MGCNCNKHNNVHTQTVITNKEELVDLKRPTVPILNDDQKKTIIIFFVGVAKGCSDGNKFVDYIIRWLIEDGIRYEKCDFESPYASKFGISGTPSIIIKNGDSILKLGWLGIALTYREIIIKLSQM